MPSGAVKGETPAFGEPASTDAAAGQRALMETSARARAILDSPHCSSIVTDVNGVIQIFNKGAERLMGFASADVTHKATPADLCDPKDLIARAEALSVEFSAPVTR